MKAIESIKQTRRNLFGKYNADVENSLFVEPRVSERTKAQVGGLTALAGGVLLGGAVIFRNEGLLVAGLVIETGGLTAVSAVGNRLDTARRVIKNISVRQTDHRS